MSLLVTTALLNIIRATNSFCDYKDREEFKATAEAYAKKYGLEYDKLESLIKKILVGEKNPRYYPN